MFCFISPGFFFQCAYICILPKYFYEVNAFFRVIAQFVHLNNTNFVFLISKSNTNFVFSKNRMEKLIIFRFSIR